MCSTQSINNNKIYDTFYCQFHIANWVSQNAFIDFCQTFLSRANLWLESDYDLTNGVAYQSTNIFPINLLSNLLCDLLLNTANPQKYFQQTETYFSFRTTDCNVFFSAFCVIAGIRTLFIIHYYLQSWKSFESSSCFKIKLTQHSIFS